MKTVLISVIVNAFFSIVFSGILWILQLALSIFPNIDKPSFGKFLWGALGIFVLFELYDIISASVLFYHCMKDPRFRKAHEETGVSWKDYKKYFPPL